jgi:hypothetical protein
MKELVTEFNFGGTVLDTVASIFDGTLNAFNEDMLLLKHTIFVLFIVVIDFFYLCLIIALFKISVQICRNINYI